MRRDPAKSRGRNREASLGACKEAQLVDVP